MGLYSHAQARFIFGKFRECLNYLQDDARLTEAFEGYKEALKNTRTFHGFIATSNTGFNCLMDVLYYPGVNSRSEDEAVKAKALQIGYNTFTSLLTTLNERLFPENRVNLLLARNQNNSSCLHIAALHANEKTFSFYLNTVEQYYISGALSLAEYRKLLTQTNDDGRTPFNSIKAPGNINKFTHYLKIAKKRLSPDELINLLSLANKKGYSPLHNSVMDNDNEAFKILCHELSKLHRNKQLSTQHYLEILTAETDNKQTLLHLIFRKSPPEILNLYLGLFTELLAMRDEETGAPIFSSRDFVKILAQQNDFDYSPLHLVQAPENLFIYLDKLNYLHDEKLLSTEDFINILTATGINGFTPLHHLLSINNSENVALYLDVLNHLHNTQNEDGKSLLPATVYLSILKALNTANVSPVLSAIFSDNAQNLELYLHTLFELYNEVDNSGEHVIHSTNCLQVLMQPNNVGFTPLHQILSKGSEEKLTIYLRYFDAFQEIENKTNPSAIVNLVNFFLSKTSNGGTILHCALSAGNNKNSQTCFQILDHLEKEGHLSAKCYANLLISRDQAGETPLSLALLAGEPQGLSLYLNKLDHFYKKGDLSGEEYRALLLKLNQQGDLPLHNAVRFQHQESLFLYLEALDKLHRIRHNTTMERLVSREKYLNVFTTQSYSRNILTELANTGNIPLINAFFVYMEKIFHESELFEMLREGFRHCTVGSREEKAPIEKYFFDKMDTYKAYCEEKRGQNQRKRPIEEQSNSRHATSSRRERHPRFFSHHTAPREPSPKRRHTHRDRVPGF